MLWSQEYDRSLRDTLALQNDIVRAVAAAGGMRISDAARAKLSAARAVAPMYEAFLQGRYYWNQRTEPSINTAITYFRKSIARSDCTPPYAALADCYNQLATLILSTVLRTSGGHRHRRRPSRLCGSIRTSWKHTPRSDTPVTMTGSGTMPKRTSSVRLS